MPRSIESKTPSDCPNGSDVTPSWFPKGRQLSDFGEDELIPSGMMPAIFPRTNLQTWAALRHKGNGPAFVKVMRGLAARCAPREPFDCVDRALCATEAR